MSQRILSGDPPVELTLRRSSRARRISLRVSGLDGKITLTMPQATPEHLALKFAQSKSAWLRAQLHRQPRIAIVSPDSFLPIEGQQTKLVLGSARRIELKNNILEVPGPVCSMAAKLEGWLKARARDRLVAASDYFSAQLGRSYSRISLRDTRSRWGSCSAEGRLMYSWRLILAPPDVLEYVAAHEVAHLKEMNHSRAFWDLVNTLLPGFETSRQWLRENSAELHRYRFRN